MSRPAEDFWAQVDSSSWYSSTAQCTCHTTDPNRHHLDICDLADDWRKQRDGDGHMGCLGMRGDGGKCREHVPATFPFCERYHHDAALRAFSDHLDQLGGRHVLHGDFESSARIISTLIHRALGGELTKRSKKQLASSQGLWLLQDRVPVPDDAAVTPPTPRACSLYRHFDAAGILLYVGISVDPTARSKTHAAQSAWWEFVSRSDIEWHASEAAAAAAERVAISDDSPIFNKAHAASERNARAIQYLIDRGALHLLKAAA